MDGFSDEHILFVLCIGFVTLYLGSIGMGCIISESCYINGQFYKGIIGK